jgi:hypothetical protein
MKHSIDTKNKAQQLYVIEGKNLADIENLTGVPYKTLQRWKAEDSWDDALKQSGNIGLQMALQQNFITAIQEAIKNNSLSDPSTADSLYKLSKLMDKMLPQKTLLSNIFNMLESTTNYIRTLKDEKFINDWVKYLPEISDYLRKKYNE